MDIKIFAKTIEKEAQNQINMLMLQKAFENSKVRIMPDVHSGKGCVIGFTANISDKVIPNIVGVDIGCGMYVANLGQQEIDLKRLDNVINENIPAGRNIRTEILEQRRYKFMCCYNSLGDTEYYNLSLGTLGGGNHFIEIDEDEGGTKYLVIHTGSRNLGKRVADFYQEMAIKSTRKSNINEIIQALKNDGRQKEIQGILEKIKKENSIPKELCYLEGEERQEYLYDMAFCQSYATQNRILIANIICTKLGLKIYDDFETIHNYIDEEGFIRKGAISAYTGERVLIPLNMRDGSIIGCGLGNEDWNYSAPHGAGRKMSRKKAKEQIPIEEYKKTMSGIYSTSVCEETLDEAPQAYKPSKEIIECISDTVKINKIIKPIYNFKAKG